MATSNGPITEGVRNAIDASTMTPYAIAKAVTARGKVKLAPAQIYKFKSGAAGLTLAILDEIATVLGLVVRGTELPIVATPPVLQETRFERDENGRPIRPSKRGCTLSPEQQKVRDYATSIQDRIRAMKRSLEADDDPLAGLNLPSRSRKGASAARILPPEEPEDDSWDNYKPPSGEAMRTTSMGSVNAREIVEKIRIIAPQIKNPGMQALAATYGGPGRSVNGIEKAKFFRFVSQMFTNNPQAAAIMMLPDLVDRFGDIARLVPDPENVGTIADVVSPEDLWPASEDPEKFKDNLKRLLASQGVVNAVIEPRKRP